MSLTFQKQVDTSILQQSETGPVADRVHGRSQFSGFVQSGETSPTVTEKISGERDDLFGKEKKCRRKY